MSLVTGPWSVCRRNQRVAERRGARSKKAVLAAARQRRPTSPISFGRRDTIAQVETARSVKQSAMTMIYRVSHIFDKTNQYDNIVAGDRSVKGFVHPGIFQLFCSVFPINSRDCCPVPSAPTLAFKEGRTAPQS